MDEVEEVVGEDEGCCDVHEEVLPHGEKQEGYYDCDP